MHPLEVAQNQEFVWLPETVTFTQRSRFGRPNQATKSPEGNIWGPSKAMIIDWDNEFIWHSLWYNQFIVVMRRWVCY